MSGRSGQPDLVGGEDLASSYKEVDVQLMTSEEDLTSSAPTDVITFDHNNISYEKQLKV